MPRTLPSALETAMDSGNFESYIFLALNSDPNSVGEFNVQPISYKLEPLQAKAKIYLADPSTDTTYFRIIRGVLIAGTPVTISSIWFRTVEQSFDGKYVYLIGEPFTRSYQIITPGSTYKEVIEFVGGQAGEFVNTDEFIFEGTAAWKNYQFYPTGRNIVISPAKKLFTILQQKYLVFATEDGWDGTANVQGDLFFFCATDTRALDYTFTDFLLTTTNRSEKRRLLARDENSTLRSNGASTAIVHNLGFLHSTAALPTNEECGSIGSGTKKTRIHLKYRTGDFVTILGSNNTFTGRIKVTEVFDTDSTPAWYQIIEKLEWYGTTEGGSMPSTIEAAAPYTPLVTGRFDTALSEADNNVQAAFETLDDHIHYSDEERSDQYLGGDGEWHNLPISLNLFLDNTASDIGGYKLLTPTHPTAAEATASATIPAAATVVKEFVTAAQPVQFLSAQLAHVHIHAAKTAGTKTAVLFAKLLHRTSGGTETVLGTSNNTSVLSGASASYDLAITIPDTPFAATDRLELNFYATPAGSGTDPTVTIYFQGTNESRVELGASATVAAGLTDAASDGKLYGRKDGAWVQSSDALLATTDITTNDVGTSKHGFAPKAPNDAAKNLDGTGAWATPYGTVTAASNPNEIFSVLNCGSSGWTGTINGATSGATVNYTNVSGNKNTLVPAATTQLGKQRLYNTTRGNYALISNSNGTSNITLTANAPANWANGDTITTLSPTVATAGYVDIEITSGESLNATSLLATLVIYDSATAGTIIILHPFVAFSASKRYAVTMGAIGIYFNGLVIVPLTSNVISAYWNAGGAATSQLFIRQSGYVK